VLHELVTGRKLWSPLVASPREIEQRRTIPPPSARADGLPPELDAIVLRALAFDPDERQASCDVLREELEQVLVGLQRLNSAARRAELLAAWFPEDRAGPEVEASEPSGYTIELSAPLEHDDATELTPPSELPTLLSQPAPEPVRPRVRWWLVAALGTLAVAGAVASWRRARPPVATAPAPVVVEKPQAVRAAPPAESVVWLVKSDPPRAEVVREADGEVIGVTPFYSEQRRGTGSLRVVLRRAGYARHTLELDRSIDVSVAVKLARTKVASHRAAEEASFAPVD
jgi:serine/threonine-protein kinase